MGKRTPSRGSRRVSNGARGRRDAPSASGEFSSSAQSMVPDLDKTLVNRLSDVVAGKRSSLILTHDNPDPDAMAAAAGMAFVYRSLGGIADSSLAYGGIIGRAENRALVRHLALPMIPIARLSLDDFDLITLVDTQHGAGNHSLPRHRSADIVVDHHPLRNHLPSPSLLLVFPRFGATSSIVTSLIRMAGLEPDTHLATALFYGVKSDTRALGRGTVPADAEAYRWLFQIADHGLLTRIEHPEVPLSHFRAYHTAFKRARIHGDVIQADLGEIYNPDIVAEIADRLLSLENVKWAIAIGEYGSDLYVSARTSDRRRNAGRQMQELTRDLGGSAGGHGSMAGARIPLVGRSSSAKRRLRKEIMARFRRSLGVDVHEGRSMI